MKLNRNYITPFISLIFLVVAVSGLLMFFHLLDGYTEVVHECLGVVFTACAICHIIINWSALKVHFKKTVFLPAAIGVAITSAVFVTAEILYPPVDLVLFNRIIKAPVDEAFKALDVDYAEARERLEKKGISIADARSIEDVWIKNNADPEEVIDLIMQR